MISDLAAVRARAEAARAEVAGLADGSREWVMHIPAQPGRDSDLVISDSLADVERLCDGLATANAESEQLRARLREAAVANESLHEAVDRAHSGCISREDLLACRRERDEALDKLAAVTPRRRIEIDPNVRIHRDLTTAGLDDATGAAPGERVIVFESEERAEWDGVVVSIDHGVGIVYIGVDWDSARRYEEPSDQPLRDFIAERMRDTQFAAEFAAIRDGRVASLRMELDRVGAHLDRAVAILRAGVDDEECRLDHHGYCQAHDLSNPCNMVLTRELLAEVDHG